MNCQKIKVKKKNKSIIRLFIISTFLFLIFCSAVFANGKNIIKNLDDLDKKGNIVEVATGTTAQLVCEKFFKNAEVRVFTTGFVNAFADLKYNKVDAVAFDRSALEYAAADSKDFYVLPETLAKNNIVIGMQFGKNELCDEVNAFIKYYKENKIYDDMYERWYGRKSDVMPEIKKYKGNKLVVGVEGTEKPSAFINAKGEYEGFDVEFAYRLGAYYGREVEIRPMPFLSLITSCSTGAIDLLISNLNGNEERRKVMLLSDPYIVTDIAVMIRKDRMGISQSSNKEKKNFFEIFKDEINRNLITENRYALILRGLKTTIVISAFSFIFGMIIASILCFMHMSKSILLRSIVDVLVEIVTGIPIIVLLMIFYYGIFGNVKINPILVAITAFSLSFGVNVSRILESGIRAIPIGQIEAGLVLGFTKMSSFFRIVIPQAMKYFVPLIKGEFIGMIKLTSVVGYITITDLTRATDLIRSKTYEAFFPLIMTSIIYYIMAKILIKLISLIEIKINNKNPKKFLKGVNLHE